MTPRASVLVIGVAGAGTNGGRRVARVPAVRRYLHHLPLQPEPRVRSRLRLQPGGAGARHDRAAVGDGAGAACALRACQLSMLRSSSRWHVTWLRRFLLFRLLSVLGFGAGIPLAGAMLFLGIFDLLLARAVRNGIVVFRVPRAWLARVHGVAALPWSLRSLPRLPR